MLRVASYLLLCGAAVLICSVPCAGDQVVAPLPPQYPGSGILTFPGRIFADDFTVAEPTGLTRVRWWGTFSDSDFSIQFYDDLDAMQTLDPYFEMNQIQPDISSFGQYTQYEVPIDPNLYVSDGQTHFISVQNDNSFWSWATDCQNNCVNSGWELGGGGWTGHAGGQAFQLLGVLVPEPSSYLLGTLALVALIWFARLRRQAVPVSVAAATVVHHRCSP